MATFGRDTPMDRPNAGGRAALFVPSVHVEESVAEHFKNGSGMVGFGNADGSVMIYFENNKFNDSSLHSWENKILKAYERMVKLAPTVNKLSADAENFEYVGYIEASGIMVRNMASLKRWLQQSGAADSAPEAEYLPANSR